MVDEQFQAGLDHGPVGEPCPALAVHVACREAVGQVPALLQQQVRSRDAVIRDRRIDAPRVGFQEGTPGNGGRHGGVGYGSAAALGQMQYERQASGQCRELREMRLDVGRLGAGADPERIRLISAVSQAANLS